MKLIAIAAVGKNNELGKDNDLIWRIPEDLKRFMVTTTSYPVIMGSRTYDSIGQPLPNRLNIVISKRMLPKKGIVVVDSPKEAISRARIEFKDKAFVIGGGKIYGQILPSCDELLLTKIEDSANGCNAYFPNYEDKFIQTMDIPNETKEGLKYSFTKWVRK